MNVETNKLFKTESFLLLIGILMLFIHYCVIKVPFNTQMGILLVLVFLLGVPHGALDFLVDEQNDILAKQSFSIKKFVSVYLFKLFAFSMFWLFPWVAFSLFILFSVYHFGETDMSSKLKNKKTATLLYAVYGIFILAILFITHLSEIAGTLPVMKSFFEKNNSFRFLEENYTLILLFITSVFISIIIWQRKNISFTIFGVVQFIMLVFILSFLPLLLAFTFYFALWHSILSVRNIFLYIKTSNSKRNFKSFCNKSALFSLLALSSIVILYFILQFFMPQINLLFALLIVLSVLTLPHLTVMHNMYKNLGTPNVKISGLEA